LYNFAESHVCIILCQLADIDSMIISLQIDWLISYTQMREHIAYYSLNLNLNVRRTCLINIQLRKELF